MSQVQAATKIQAWFRGSKWRNEYYAEEAKKWVEEQLKLCEFRDKPNDLLIKWAKNPSIAGLTHLKFVLKALLNLDRVNLDYRYSYLPKNFKFLDNPYRKRTALHFAAEKGNTDVVDLLLESGANVTAETEEEQTALVLAAENGHADVVTSLFKKDIPDSREKRMKGTAPALLRAAKNGHIKVVRILLDLSNLHLLNDYVDEFADYTEDGCNALHFAIKNGHANVVKLLLEHKAFDDCHWETMENDAGFGVLHLAVENRHIEVVKELLKSSYIDVDQRIPDNLGIEPHYQDQFTPLHLAVEMAGIDIIEVLINAVANVNAKDRTGKTPLHVAVEMAAIEDIKVLINAGANVNAMDNEGKTPFHLAVLKNNKDIQAVIKDKIKEITFQKWKEEIDKKDEKTISKKIESAEIFKCGIFLDALDDGDSWVITPQGHLYGNQAINQQITTMGNDPMTRAKLTEEMLIPVSKEMFIDWYENNSKKKSTSILGKRHRS